jgi:hypothetical protein
MSANVIAVITFIESLQDEPRNIKEIKECTGLANATIQRYIRIFKNRKMIRVEDWHRYGGNYRWIPSYVWNTEKLPDTPKPEPLSNVERNKRTKERLAGIKHANLLHAGRERNET